MRDMVIQDEVRVGDLPPAVRTDPDHSAIDPVRGRLVAKFTAGRKIGEEIHLRSFS